MPIVFQQPGAYDPAVMQAYGRLQQENINADRMMRGGAGGGGGGVGPTGDYGSAPSGGSGGGSGGNGGPSLQDQLDFQQATLNQAENMRLQRLQQAVSAVDADDTLDPEAKDELKRQINMGPAGLEVLQRRQALATVRHTEMQNQAYQQAMAQQEAMSSARADMQAGNLEKWTTVLQHPGMRDEIENELDPTGDARQVDPQGFSREVSRQLRERGGEMMHLNLPDGSSTRLQWPWEQRQRVNDQQEQRFQTERQRAQQWAEDHVRREANHVFDVERQLRRDPNAVLPARPDWLQGPSPLTEEALIQREIAARRDRRLRDAGIPPSTRQQGGGDGGQDQQPTTATVQQPNAPPIAQAIDQILQGVQQRQQPRPANQGLARQEGVERTEEGRRRLREWSQEWAADLRRRHPNLSEQQIATYIHRRMIAGDFERGYDPFAPPRPRPTE